MNQAADQPTHMKFEETILPILEAALIDERSSHASSPGRVHRRLGLVSVGVLAVMLAVIVPIVLPRGAGGAAPAAAEALHLMALRAARLESEPAPEPGQYLYTKSYGSATSLYVTGFEVPNFFFETTTETEFWIGPDGSGRRLDVVRVSFPSMADRAAWKAAGEPPLAQESSSDETFGRGELYVLDTAALPTAPRALRSWIEKRTGGDPWRTFSMVGDLLRYTSTPPPVRAALYLVAADLDGVEFVGRTRDATGRSGVAVAFTHSGIRNELIFDPQTAELLGEDDVLVEDSTVDVESGGPGAIYGLVGPAGTRAFTTTYVSSGITDAVTERPRH